MRVQREQLIAALSNLGTSYNLININLAHVIIQNQYCGGDHCESYVATAGSICMVGAIIGQLTFGYVGDCIGRTRALQLTQILSIFGALSSAFAVPFDSDDRQTVFAFIALTRLILGIGVGGVYPLSATISAESSSAANRGRSVAMVFSMQGLGTLLVPLAGMLIVAIVGTPEARTAHGQALHGISWRVLLGIGAFPGILLIPFNRTQGQPQNQLQQNGEGNATASGDTSSAASFAGSAAASQGLAQALRTRSNWPKLLGCAGGWFLFDVTFYGNTIFQPTVLQVIFKVDSAKGTPVDGNTLSTNLCWQLAIIALIGLPGYYVAIYFMDRLGRKVIQIQGFAIMAALYAVLALFLDGLEDYPALLLFVYGMTYFFSNFGPNSTTFILPSETFPPEVRSTLNGFCAATGKLGATIGSACFKPLISAHGTAVAFWLCAVCAVFGVVITSLFVQDMRCRDIAATSLIQDVGMQVQGQLPPNGDRGAPDERSRA